ncbi:hypothetical protein MMPV_009952 [Pyropia vietnamensis]
MTVSINSGSDSEAPASRAAGASTATAQADGSTSVIGIRAQCDAATADNVATTATTASTAVIPAAPRTVIIPHGPSLGSNSNAPVVASEVEWILCADCHLPVHPACLAAMGITDTVGWRCDRCIECLHCSSPSSVAWHKGYTMCDACMVRYTDGHYCPKCKMVYPADDTSSDMICCDDCSAWWHINCANMSSAELAYYGKNDKAWYTCPRCRLDRRASVAADKSVVAAAAAAVQEAKVAAAAANRRRVAAAARRQGRGRGLGRGRGRGRGAGARQWPGAIAFHLRVMFTD